MRESQLEGWFRRRVHLLGGHTIKLAPIEAGTPDRLVMMPGSRMYLVELKTDRGQLRQIQVVWHNKAARLGIPVYVLHGKTECQEWLRKITEDYRLHLDSQQRRALADGITPINEENQ